MNLVEKSLVTLDGNQSLPELAKQLRKQPFCALRGDTDRTTLHLYSVESSGENANGRGVTPFRKEHMETVIRAMLSTRGEVDFDSERIQWPDPHDSDMLLGTAIKSFFVQAKFPLPGLWARRALDSLPQHTPLRKADKEVLHHLFAGLCQAVAGYSVSFRCIFKQRCHELAFSGVRPCPTRPELPVPGGEQRQQGTPWQHGDQRDHQREEGRALNLIGVFICKVDPNLLTKLPVQQKIRFLGDAQIRDTARSRNASRDSGHDVEPMSWSCQGREIMEEFVHRFRPRSVSLLCASDPLEALPMLEMKIPVLAF